MKPIILTVAVLALWWMTVRAAAQAADRMLVGGES